MLNNHDDLLQRRLRHVNVRHDPASRTVWVEFKYKERPCFTIDLLTDVLAVQRSIRKSVKAEYLEAHEDRLLFQVVSSTDKQVFSLGGDLEYFISLIETKNREALSRYARICVDIQYASVTHYDIPFTTIALVEGEALGGGFEGALSANVLVAERKARFGFPEITFGMFPGMGALSLLVRKITPGMARRLIMDHRVYTAAELYELGVVDVLAPDGGGKAAVADYIKRHTSAAPGLHGFQAAVDRALPISYEELLDVVELWVDAAMQLSEKNRRLMAYFARAQIKRYASGDKTYTSDEFRSASS
ncbi:MAG: enoyl-CoA hydratase/isomerase family protein [Gammaproteobacteria bacterium]|nr:MAG: enoyl-CoA hydratase/isomerase family protein [Gammaproteobacteria bacterium]